MWFGYDQPRSLGQKEYGSTTALPIWLDYMEDIISSVEYSPPKIPANLIAKKINLTNGLEKLIQMIRTRDSNIFLIRRK